MALINNSIKYSTSEQYIEINFEDRDSHTSVTITSYGPLISAGELSKIFDKGYRSESAKKIYSEGMGIGLFVAQAAAKANRTKILASSTSLGTQVNGIGLARNSFSFEIRDSSQK